MLEKEVLTLPVTRGATSPFGPAPLSQGLRIGPFVFISGQVGIDPATGQVAGPDIHAQTRQALINMRGLLAEAGLTMADVAKVTIYITDTTLWGEMNTVYREFFAEPFPTRATVGIRLNRPDLLIEMDAIAVKRD
jgi:2-iminobutanoate/2-iminopropanoate deaminase